MSIPTLMIKKISVYLALYPLLCNIVFPTILLINDDTKNNFYSFCYLFVLCLNGGLLILLLKLFQFCKLYKISILTPFIWTTLFVITNIEKNIFVVIISVISSYVIVILLLCKWFRRKKKKLL